MTRFFAIVDAGDAGVTGVLAGEALRRAARETGHPIEIEVRTAQGVVNPVSPGPAADGDTLLFVGNETRADAATRTRADRLLTLEAVLADPAAALGGNEASGPAAGASVRKIVAITSCPTGIAHTFMAAEGLQEGARQLGYEIHVETQGSVGAGTPLTSEQIAGADVVIIAADREVDRGRFAGKRVFAGGTKPAITGGAALIEKALAEAKVQGGKPEQGAAPSPAADRAGPYKHLMTGVSFMLPFVVAGGLLIALAFALGGIHANDDAAAGTLAHALFEIGAKGGFALMVPALAGYIAYSIADRPGIAPGMIGGMLASSLGAGFLGGIVAGFIAGYGVHGLNRVIRLPKNLQGLKPVLILPLLGTLLTGLLMIYAVGTPVAAALAFLTQWLRDMQGSNAILLGLILGGMMAFDMGGPVNKAAYAFSVGLVASQVYTPMAATMAAGMDGSDDGGRHAPAARHCAGDPAVSQPLHGGRAGSWRGGGGAWPRLHQRRRDPVRGARSGSGDPLADGRFGDRWSDLDGRGGGTAGAAWRHFRPADPRRRLAPPRLCRCTCRGSPCERAPPGAFEAPPDAELIRAQAGHNAQPSSRRGIRHGWDEEPRGDRRAGYGNGCVRCTGTGHATRRR